MYKCCPRIIDKFKAYSKIKEVYYEKKENNKVRYSNLRYVWSGGILWKLKCEGNVYWE